MDFMLNEYQRNDLTPMIDFEISDSGELTLLNTKAEEQQREPYRRLVSYHHF